MKHKSQYISAATWQQGRRSTNEDAYCIWHANISNRQYILAMVCDGIGGLAEGEKASSFLMLSLRDTITQFITNTPHRITLARLRAELLRELYKSHTSLCHYGTEHSKGIGTTISLLLICNHHYLRCNIGDSRIYTGRHRLKQRTQDDSTPHKALLKSIGHGPYPYPKITCHRIHKSQSFLLCTDGFYHFNHLSLRKKLPALTTDTDIQTFLNRLYHNAVTAGETDNATAILIKRLY